QRYEVYLDRLVEEVIHWKSGRYRGNGRRLFHGAVLQMVNQPVGVRFCIRIIDSDTPELGGGPRSNGQDFLWPKQDFLRPKHARGLHVGDVDVYEIHELSVHLTRKHPDFYESYLLVRIQEQVTVCRYLRGQSVRELLAVPPRRRVEMIFDSILV